MQRAKWFAISVLVLPAVLAVWGCDEDEGIVPSGIRIDAEIQGEPMMAVGTYTGSHPDPDIPNDYWQPKHNFRPFAETNHEYYEDYLLLVGPVAEELHEQTREHLETGFRGVDVSIEGSFTGTVFSGPAGESKEVELTSFEIIR